MPKQTATRRVSPEVFKRVYDSPHSLPGKHKWMTSDVDVRRVELILGMKHGSIGAPLWLSGDVKDCPKCGREINWLDIVGSGVAAVHSKEMIATVILGSQKFVNVEAPRAIQGLVCYKCKTPIQSVRSFKCHNWAYARQDLLKALERMK
jgi:hypothetical protein